MPWEALLNDFSWALLGIIGGIAWEFNRWLTHAIGEIDWVRVIVHAFVSGFSGYISGDAMYYFYPGLAHAASGVGGWFGCGTLKWVARVIDKKLGTRLDDD